VRVIRLNDFLAYIGYTKGLGTGVSVTREPAPGTKRQPMTPGKTSPLKRSPRAAPPGVSGRFRKSRGVKSKKAAPPAGDSPR